MLPYWPPPVAPGFHDLPPGKRIIQIGPTNQKLWPPTPATLKKCQNFRLLAKNFYKKCVGTLKFFVLKITFSHTFCVQHMTQKFSKKKNFRIFQNFFLISKLALILRFSAFKFFKSADPSGRYSVLKNTPHRPAHLF